MEVWKLFGFGKLFLNSPLYYEGELCLQKLQNYLSEEFTGIIKYPNFGLYEGCIKNLNANTIWFFYKPPGIKNFMAGIQRWSDSKIWHNERK